MIMEVNKCSIVNLKFAIPQFFDIFVCPHPNNQRPLYDYLCTFGTLIFLRLPKLSWNVCLIFFKHLFTFYYSNFGTGSAIVLIGWYLWERVLRWQWHMSVRKMEIYDAPNGKWQRFASLSCPSSGSGHIGLVN